MTQNKIIGEKNIFAIEYCFYDDNHDTEISMYVEGANILAFERNGKLLTTRWNIDELAIWLRNFIDEMAEDPYPIDCEGSFAAQKDDIAREYNPDDDDLFDSYYQQLYNWGLKHRWHMSASGAILADVYFQLVGDAVEISWDNRDVESNVTFKYLLGGARIPKEYFKLIIESFLTEYAVHWF